MEHDMVTMEAAAAYFRIVRLNMRDVSPIIKSFGNIGFNFVEVQQFHGEKAHYIKIK